MTDTVLAEHTVIDLAQARCRDYWLHHPVLGDPSWDTFEREAGNPIYTGAAPHNWPVNGFLFRDPPSDRWYAYISLYPRGYWPPGGVLMLREEGEGWQAVGMALSPDPHSFEGDGQRAGGTVDVSLVYEDGRYHMVYGWCDPDNQRGGLAYAWSTSPEGPFYRSQSPLHDDAHQPALADRYVRAYAPTLIRRQNDWLILHMMSTARNAGGTWALGCMTARQPEGPYTPPQLVLMPQSQRFHPPLVEFYPQFVHEGYVYAPATSVALNRSFQTLFRAPVEQAHRAEAWEIEQYGSVWHDEVGEEKGIWGQTFAAQVAPAGFVRGLYPCKTHNDVGTIHLARRRWGQPYRDGFVLSAPNGPALAVLRRTVRDFEVRVVARSTGAWALCWGCDAPLGPDRPYADASLHPLVRTRRIELRCINSDYRIAMIDADGSEYTVARWSNRQPMERAEQIEVVRVGGLVRIVVNGHLAWQGTLPSWSGRIELLAEAGVILEVDRCELSGALEANWECWLSSEGLAGSADASQAWQPVTDEHFRFGIGHVSTQPQARVKWNFAGTCVRLYAPCGPEYGQCDVWLNGEWRTTLDFKSAQHEQSQLRWSQDLPYGRHALVLQTREASVPCDLIEVKSM
ncbi:MAG: hypothetical protein RMN25_02805 [Anaerolineae bacterium]|nr:hypothetical protein [Thermoflexales bacterium]MDW8406686.1 hypothetical protein [Anaerolineae bacterium]